MLYYKYIEKFETNISQKFRLVEVSFRIAEASMVEIGSSYRRLRIRIIETIAFKVSGMKNEMSSNYGSSSVQLWY